MITEIKNVRCPSGASLVSTMVSISVLSIAIIGTAQFRYYAALDSRKAAMHRTAARLALTLCESWRGQGFDGTETYDPIAHLSSDLTISESDVEAVEYDDTFTLLGSYAVELNGVDYYATLSWKDVSTGLRALNIIVTWSQRGMNEGDDDKSFVLTTYTFTTD